MRKDQSGFHVIGLLFFIVVVGVVGAIGYRVIHKDKKDPGTNSAQFSSDAVERGKYLSKNNCDGQGSKKLGSAPMRPGDLSTILPYGLVAGGHVTPVDHQYFSGKNQKAAPSTYDVLAPANGTLVTVEVRPKGNSTYDVRGVISYSCTFFSYFDLANSLSEEIAAQMPAGWNTKNNGPMAVDIPVKEGQVIARVGGQTLDYAVWDTTKSLDNLLVQKAYSNYEPWKTSTVPPTDFYTDEVTASLLPYYVRTAEPRDGKLAYDIDGKAVGGWFKEGTNGYIGAFSEKDFSSMSYADGHLALIPDFLDPDGWVFSTGAINHGSQYSIKSPSVAPDTLDTSSGIVKYELAQYEHKDETGGKWLGTSVPKTIKLSTTGPTMATVLVEMKAKRELKVEVFEGKTASQVNGFTSNAITYDRGDKATTMMAGQN
ncbi:MAG TPA: hypothetical protein VLF43_00435 [Candidatus Saccharimonadales bacterium]|nr:hypothetical protein [Candidatus Saccharimonadales bacterium]